MINDASLLTYGAFVCGSVNLGTMLSTLPNPPLSAQKLSPAKALASSTGVLLHDYLSYPKRKRPRRVSHRGRRSTLWHAESTSRACGRDGYADPCRVELCD